MCKKSPKNHPRLRVLISGALPPPVGGVGIYYQMLLNSSLSQQVELRFVQTSSQKRELSSTGRATLSNILYAIGDCWRFIMALLVHDPQICHIGTAFGLSFVKHSLFVCIARVFGSQVLLHPHCSLTALYYERPRWWRLFFAWVIKISNNVIGLSREWLQLQSIVPGCQVYPLSNAIDLKQYSTVAKNQLAKTQKSAPCKILYLGFLGKNKGSFDLVDALIEIRSRGMNVMLDLVGGELAPGELGALRNKIWMANINDSVRLHQPVYESEKLDFLQNADLFAYPSYSEGMPIAVIEAMACGLPIVASRIGGLVDLVKDEVNGLLVAPGKPHKLADALYRIGNDDELRHSMQEMSYRIALDGYDIDQHVAQLVNIYRLVLSPKI